MDIKPIGQRSGEVACQARWQGPGRPRIRPEEQFVRRHIPARRVQRPFGEIDGVGDGTVQWPLAGCSGIFIDADGKRPGSQKPRLPRNA